MLRSSPVIPVRRSSTASPSVARAPSTPKAPVRARVVPDRARPATSPHASPFPAVRPAAPRQTGFVTEDIMSRGDFTSNTGFSNEGSLISSSNFIIHSSEEKEPTAEEELERMRIAKYRDQTRLAMNVRY